MGISGNGDELQRLVKNGYDSMWIHPGQVNKAVVYEKMARLPTIEKELAPAKRIVNIQEVGAAFTKYLYEGEITDSCVKMAEKLSDSLVACISEDPTCIKEITGLAHHDLYTYLHSIRVSAYATAIAIKVGITDQAHLRLIALGGVFHDVGKSAVPLNVINKQGPLLETEWTIMRNHPTAGLERTKDSLLHHITREIIIHHHERLNGSGYPHGLEKNSILPEVQIATMADIFDALTSSRSYQNKRTRYEALDFIKHRLLRSDVGVDVYKGLIECLAG
ncbi:MAG: HD domain-containing protein [Proteobacteria bacterium]|nr:HD domain-containing protein [Pseudomonadota bacterium]